MKSGRILLAVLLLGIPALPLAWPFLAVYQAGVWGGYSGRLLVLSWNSFLLAAGVIALALPAGTLLAVLIDRVDVPGHRLARIAVLASLFLPLPVLVAGWQQLIGPFLPWTEGMPWPEGLGPAILLHALAGLPWVTVVAGAGLAVVEPELEEDALLAHPPAWVLWHVSVPRAAGFLVAAAGLLAWQTLGEITITDLFQVRTLAEEIYTQLVGPELGSAEVTLGRATAVALGLVATGVVVLFWLVRSMERLSPSGHVVLRRRPILSPGSWRWPVGLCVLIVTFGLIAVPTLGLVLRASVVGSPPVWEPYQLVRQLAATARADGGVLVNSLLVAWCTGVVAAAGAALGCWLARTSRVVRAAGLILTGIAWTMPGPVLALGLKDLIPRLLYLTDPISDVPARLLWFGPSVLPWVIVGVLRYFPLAVLLIWLRVRLIPRELIDLARLDGLGFLGELRHVFWPLAWRTCGTAAFAVGILSLGELSAGKLVSTAGGETFAEVIWTQMHYGLGADLAARCLLLQGVILGALALACLTSSRWNPAGRS